jgi:hypothetical protein
MQSDARSNGQMVRNVSPVEDWEISAQEKSGLRRLVELFPRPTPMRISISVSVSRAKGQALEENAATEYGVDPMLFFESRLPLELEDKLHLQNSDGSLAADAFVVGLHFRGGRRPIAARFVAEVRNWILQG